MKIGVQEKVAVVNSKTRNSESLCSALNIGGFSVDRLLYDQPSLDRIINESYHSVIAALGNDHDTFSFCAGFRTLHQTTPIIFLTDTAPINYIEKVFLSGYPDHLVSSQMPDNSKWIIANLKKFTAPDPSGMGHYIDSGCPSETFVINNSNLKDQYVAKVINFLNRFKIRERVIHTAEEILDEMITNALFNAPVDTNGMFLYQHYDRKEDVVLSEVNSARLSYVVDNDKIYLSVKDPFGSLTKNKLFSYLSKCYTKELVHVENKKGGAGIGLHKMFRLSHNFVVNIIPGSYSEVIVCISQESEILNQETASLNVFVRER
jgi:hypothetical protein